MAISVEFSNALAACGVITGGIINECSCGILHFYLNSDHSYDYEKGELEELLQKEKNNPEQYMSSDYDIRKVNFGGKSFVFDCPCRALEKLEQHIWANRFLSANYIEKRGKKEFMEAEKEWDELKNLKQELKNINDKELTIKKLFWPSGNIKSIWREDKVGNRFGQQRDWFENGDEAANFEWRDGEYKKIKKIVLTCFSNKICSSRYL